MHGIDSVFRWFDALLLNSAGVRPDVLRLEIFRGERSRYRSLGFAIFMSSVLVASPAGYLASVVSSSIAVSVAAALVTGLLFLSLQSLLMRLVDRDVNRRLSWATLALILFSILLGGMFSVVSSRPLELALFADAINARVLTNANSSLLGRLVVLQELKREYSTVRYAGNAMVLLHFMIFTTPILTRWLMPVSSAYKSYISHEEDEAIKEIDSGSVGVGGVRSEEILRALDDASQTAERIITSLDQSHEILRRSLASQAERNR